MITPAYVRTMAAYNAEMNRRLYTAAARLSDTERRQPRGAFWGSIHGTLNHLLWGDRQWMSRFDNWPKPDVAIKQSAGLIEDFKTPLVVGTALCVLLALGADLGLAGVERAITPWSRQRSN